MMDIQKDINAYKKNQKEKDIAQKEKDKKQEEEDAKYKLEIDKKFKNHRNAYLSISFVLLLLFLGTKIETIVGFIGFISKFH